MSSSYRSQKATANSLTLLEKLDIIPAVASVLSNVVAAFVAGAIRSKKTAGPLWYRYVRLSSIRAATSRFSARQQHLLFVPTDTIYEQFCKEANIQPDSEVLEDGTKAHWLGDKNAEKLIINFHGGGYVVPASPGMFKFMHSISEHLKAQGKPVAILFLSYDLAPGATYPRQLQQAAALMLHVLNNLHRSPKNIFMTGDSAGAHLMLSLLSHIAHPWNENHPSSSSAIALKGGIPKIELSERLGGAILISPWVSFNLKDDSFTRNARKDCIATQAGTQWSRAFMNSPHPHTANSDFYNQAITAPPSWWKDLTVEEVLVVAGADEVLVDGITQFVKKLSTGLGSDRVEFLAAKDEYHDQPNLDIELGYTQDGAQSRRIKGWLGSKL
ncbi:hypothetical protein PVAG01_00599 [Phlyctema vagabunda]|uniref:Alpha/beta hydrolase fold-3 domain-containing protein n=1 Tax=Phlyctema vagabunda TaxID=108571 RepID=A0ABR4PUQ4_9HELO